MASSNSFSPLPLTRYIVESRLWGDNPLFLVDIGASGGLQDRWRVFAGRLRAIGFDPLVSEIDRLNALETEPRVRYEAAYVGCRNFDERFPPALRRNRSRTKSNDPWKRSSAARAQDLQQESQGQSFIQQEFNSGAPVVRTDRVITLDEYFPPPDRELVDFIKIDTDGHDIEALLGGDQMLASDSVLAVSIEAQFHGPIHECSNTFGNIDRFLRERGFTLFDLDPYRYSRAALPAPFVFNMPAQTRSGQVLWAEATYFRDLADPEYESLWRFTVTTERVLKLACLFELFDLPDCAAELLVTRGGALAADVRDRLLDLLAGGGQGAYAGLVDRFEDDSKMWYPRHYVGDGSRSEQPTGQEAAAASLASAATDSLPAVRLASDNAGADGPAPAPRSAADRDFDRLRDAVSVLKEQHAAVRQGLRRTAHMIKASTTEG